MYLPRPRSISSGAARRAAEALRNRPLRFHRQGRTDHRSGAGPRATRRSSASAANSTRPMLADGILKATRGRVRRGLRRGRRRTCVEAIEFGIDNIRRFHEEQMPEPMWLKEMRPGAFAGDRLHADPLGGALRAARQGRVPVGDDDDLRAGGRRRRAGDRHLHAAGAGRLGRRGDAGRGAHRRGGDASTNVGGAQAVAAVAYGTETVKPALKIVGPGSPWVVAAKRLLSGVIDPGLPAGPSEAIIFADDSVRRRPRRARPPDRGRARAGLLRLSGHPQPPGGRGSAGGAARPLGSA